MTDAEQGKTPPYEAAFLWLQKPPIPPMPVRMLPVCTSAVRALPQAGQRGGGEEHKVRIAQGRTAVQGIAEAVPDGKGVAPGDGGAAALPAGGNGSLYEKDAYGAYTICNIYYDTGDWRLIRKSLEKTVYKEKLRIRSYGVPTGDDKVFVELKKKYDGVVYKRRVAMTAAWRFFKNGSVNFL